MKLKLGSKGRKTAAVALAGVLAITSFLTYSTYTSKSIAKDVASETEEAIEENYPEVTKTESYDGVLSKNETVYVIMDSDGKQKEVLVSEWLQNGSGADKITDESLLKEIENTSGSETYKMKGKILTWDASGNDIHYQGRIDEPLPVSVDVTYYLDGKRMSADEIKGKSGKVKICFNYNVSEIESSNGYSITHPYVMASGLILDADNFRNVTVSSGKIINDGSRSVCLGLAMPGLSNSLGLGGKISIPESVTITADTDNFTIDGTYTVAMSGLMQNVDTSKLDSAEGLIEELESAFSELSDASSELLEGSKALQQGVSAVSSGAEKLKSGAAQLLSGATELNKGLGQLSQNSAALNAATTQVTNSIFDNATTQLRASLIKGGVSQEDAAAITLTRANYTQILGNLSSNMGPEGSKAIAALQKTLDDVVTYENSIIAYTNGVDAAYGGSTQLLSGAEQLADGSSELSEKIVNELIDGVKELTQGMEKFDQQGVKKLVASLDSSELKEVSARLKAVCNASKTSKLFGGKASGMKGESRLIFKTEAIGE